MKDACVTPIFESGKKDVCSNCRLVYLQSGIPKMFESSISEFLSVEFKAILCDQQHGYRMGCCIPTNLLDYKEKILEAI